MSIRKRLVVIFVALIATILAIFGTSFWIIQDRELNSRVIDLAGRQSMLSQKLAKDYLNYRYLPEDRAVEVMRATAGIFDESLRALRHGGGVPYITGPGSTGMLAVPVPSPRVKDLLDRVEARWRPLAQTLAEGDHGVFLSESFYEDLSRRNIHLLEETGAAVREMVREIHDKEDQLLRISGGAGLLGLLLISFLVWRQGRLLETVTADLAASQERQELALKGAEMGFWVLEQDAGRIAINARFAEIFGYSADTVEVSLEEWAGHLHAEDRERFVAVVQAEYSTAAPGFEVAFRALDPNGDIRWAISKGAVVAWRRDGSVRRIAGTVQDITARKRAEAKEQRLQSERNEALLLLRDSIQYASRIQRSILPPEAVLASVFAEHFVVWEPRDRVGGDMYWYRSWGRGALVLLGDCTGHGVPGAFMTLISNGALDEAYLETPPGDTATLLHRMHQLIQASLGQDRDAVGDSDDGIEIGACYLSGKEDRLTFSGARFDLFVLTEDGEVSMIKGDKPGLGYRSTPKSTRFTKHEIAITPGARFYMTSDGLIDQIGGEKRRAFGKKRFTSLLNSLSAVPMADQGKRIMRALVEYQGKEKRRDDVSLIGFKWQTVSDSPGKSARFELPASLLTGFEPVDNDHRRLHKMLVQLGEAVEQNRGLSATTAILDELIEYTDWHFRHEERLMQTHAYPNLEAHKAEHGSLIRQVLEIQGDVKAGKKEVSADLLKFLRDWLIHHIEDDDRRLGVFLSERTISQTLHATPSRGQGDSADFFVLGDDLRVGFDPIDDDHIRLVQLVNRFHDAMREPRDTEVAMASLNGLVDYTSWHFRHEERLMQISNYPEVEDHKREHGRLIRQVLELQARVRGSHQEYSTDLDSLMKVWLTEHIYKMDKKLASFLQNNSAAKG